MLRKEVQVTRPQRWDVPFAEDQSKDHVEVLLAIAPFSSMREERFPPSCGLRDILKNDTRIREYVAGDVIVREQEYGNSAFMVLDGQAHIALQSLANYLPSHSRPGLAERLRRLAGLVFRSRVPEYRAAVTSATTGIGRRRAGEETRLFLQDVPGVLASNSTLEVQTGELFGEVAALSRTPRVATVFAEAPCRLLEIRWQGLRDLMRFDTALRDHVHGLYRQNSLAAHLRETPLFSNLAAERIGDVVAATEFETFGDFEWHRPYKNFTELTPNERIEAEPLIAREGNDPNGLLLIRNGFARMSVGYGHGYRTVSYLGKGGTYGLNALYTQWRTGRTTPLAHSLRAIGYVDILRVPTNLIEQLVFEPLSARERDRWDERFLNADDTTEALSNQSTNAVGKVQKPRGNSPPTLDPGLLEEIVEKRYLNGTQTMIIDMDRCTRCDDCVRACSDTHDNNPRFVRQGPQLGRMMVASACMHCVDPVCMIGCPTGAIGRDQRSGSVTINDGTCIGCKTCANSCPYEAIRMVEARDGRGQLLIDQSTMLPIAKATKCDLCTGLLGGPACERACPHDALVRIDLTTPDVLASFLDRKR